MQEQKAWNLFERFDKFPRKLEWYHHVPTFANRSVLNYDDILTKDAAGVAFSIKEHVRGYEITSENFLSDEMIIRLSQLGVHVLANDQKDEYEYDEEEYEGTEFVSRDCSVAE